MVVIISWVFSVWITAMELNSYSKYNNNYNMWKIKNMDPSLIKAWLK